MGNWPGGECVEGEGQSGGSGEMSGFARTGKVSPMTPLDSWLSAKVSSGIWKSVRLKKSTQVPSGKVSTLKKALRCHLEKCQA